MFLTNKKYLLSTMLITLGLMSAVAGCNNADATAATTKVADLSDVLMTNVVSDPSSQDTITTYQTVTAEVSDIEEFFYTRCRFIFPNYTSLNQPYDYGTVTFVRYNISFIGGGGYITEGTSIATLRLNIDPVAREEARIALEKAESSYRNTSSKRLESLDTQLAKIDSAETIYEQQILEMEYNDSLLAYNEYVAEQEEKIAKLREQYELYSNETMEFDIIAPHSGMFAASDNYNAGDIIEYDNIIGTLYDTSTMQVSCNSDNLKYGDKVTLSFDIGNTIVEFSGDVISSGNLLYNTDDANCIIDVTLTSEFDISNMSYNALLRNFNLSSSTTKATNALIIPTSAIEGARNNSGTVSIYKDGGVYKSNVKLGYIGREYSWVVGGLNEGDTILE